ncbi:hypothetical protein UFOVP1217_105 [uncultured Caudovirales phage]|uniref:Uncharacterized protein n=1 Tax=uncultured Caudovirales phage TaxID=2100421 RepID=A0A6J5P3Z7_9CAUD|nr:hypothetical protein UFOVP465_183 [uncultured Caudovirales phage]CAB4156108.1 hypothetical protein UFOVP666_41 [uncultured Caudovirales phage]CAB4160289.1 hypothetical protein UFOVP727_118 [uncultured Caudovirales phage]CAB4164706.1 hypothetical protein UFOVP819_69 [uncultured Caudovirales phage]CAB4171811.1 hypothetical protein UFOVP926_18 [uncultured Caudovirales phage]
MAFPITYEARQNGKLQMLVVASEKGKFSLYRANGSTETEKDSPGSKNIFDDPKIGFGYMGIGNIMSEGIDEPKITEGASAELIDSLVKEMQKSSK